MGMFIFLSIIACFCHDIREELLITL